MITHVHLHTYPLYSSANLGQSQSIPSKKTSLLVKKNHTQSLSRNLKFAFICTSFKVSLRRMLFLLACLAILSSDMILSPYPIDISWKIDFFAIFYSSFLAYSSEKENRLFITDLVGSIESLRCFVVLFKDRFALRFRICYGSTTFLCSIFLRLYPIRSCLLY